jgi:branched-chain amino acid transport system permease protein
VKTACSAITVLDFGRVIASGDAEEVFAHTAVVDAYLGAEEASLSDA